MNLQRKSHFFSNFFIFFSYFVVNTLFLSQYPFIHSDESWLSGLTRAVIEYKTFGVTEPFFDLLPRYPHAIKILFHILQVPFILLGGYSPFAVRLLSITAGTVSLFLFHHLYKSWFPSAAAVIILLLAFDIQFIYASHMARQEILLVLCLALAFFFYRRGQLTNNPREYRLASIVIGISIGIHPNSFLISLPIAAFLMIDVLDAFSAGKQKMLILKTPAFRHSIRRLIEYILIISLFAAFFIGLSYLLDSRFLLHYSSFGDSVGVGEAFYMKIFSFPDFYAKLFYRISGTYYTPAIKLQFILFGAALAASPVFMYFHPSVRSFLIRVLTALLFLNIGTLILGKFSQPSIILHFPLYYLIIGAELHCVFEGRGRERKGRKFPAVLTAAVLCMGTLINTGWNLGEEFHLIGRKSTTTYERYTEYEKNISAFVPPDAKVLANLNSEYYFDFGVLKDYRNLSYLGKAGLSFRDYISSRGIEYILYPQEMDLIFERRPVWNILYGNVYEYYPEMQHFLTENCRYLGEFTSPVYGMRITRYSGTEEWKVRVYEVIHD